MKIDNKAGDSLVSSSSLGSASSVTGESRSGASAATGTSEDRVSLSNASSLVAAAKNVRSADRQARINSLAAQVRAGQYKPDLSQVSHAIIQGMFG
ncbi:MAG TPA: flagellar biosynthesis anti-sigma factor FlgM [Bryobacteraceae bacterium]|jgi:anti-sigma28 factor (negative regulator of flagellin synthesis)|nr:flagellar biosynthesis anti-sigma factor FlgM [Bryobacteraceae bacterium]